LSYVKETTGGGVKLTPPASRNMVKKLGFKNPSFWQRLNSFLKHFIFILKYSKTLRLVFLIKIRVVKYFFQTIQTIVLWATPAAYNKVKKLSLLSE